MRYEESVRIGADPETIWTVLADLEHWPDWTASMARVEVLGDGPIGVGTRVRVKQPRLPTVVWRVTEWQPGRSFTWEAERTPVPSVGEHRIEPAGDGGSTVSLVFEQRGPLAPLLGLLSGRMTRRYVALEAAGLRTRCESARRG
jgi:uncharacterized membrane protein